MLKSALPVLCWAAFLVAGPSLVGAEKPTGDSAKGSQSPEKIVFTLLHEGKVAIRIMNPDGTKQTSVTKADAGEWTPALSPDGKQIALLVVERARSGDMYVMKADGTGRRRLTNSGARTIAYGPAWSPDGKRIAFAEMKIETNGNVTTGVKEIGLFVMDSDGKNRKRLVQGSGSLPAWSPDGKRILYTVTEKSGDTFNFKLHVIDADGRTHAKQLLKDDAAMGSWSPDGGKRLLYLGTVVDGKGRHIFVANADGSNRRQVTKDEDVDQVLPIVGAHWSRDGKRIYFCRMPTQGSVTGETGIFVMDANGTNVKCLTKGGGIAILGGFSMFLMDSALIAEE